MLFEQIKIGNYLTVSQVHIMESSKWEQQRTKLVEALVPLLLMRTMILAGKILILWDHSFKRYDMSRKMTSVNINSDYMSMSNGY